MKKTEIRYIAEDMIDELRELPDGSETTSGRLLIKAGYSLDALEYEDLCYYHEALFRAAKANHITLNMSKHENKDGDYPWNLDVTVHNAKAQIKCPQCGSRDTARILYGMPSMNDDIQEKIDNGKIMLGGCSINAIEAEDGTIIHLEPKRYCNHCRKTFASPAYWKKNGLIASYVDLTEGIEFEVGGYFDGTTCISIRKNVKGALVHVDYYPYRKSLPLEDRQITSLRWMRLVNRLFNELYVHEWKKKFINPGVLDGTNWHLEIKLRGRRKLTISGSNDYPPYWSELKALFRTFRTMK